MSSACRPISWNGVACFGALVYTFQIYFEFFSYRWNPRARGENLLAECGREISPPHANIAVVTERSRSGGTNVVIRDDRSGDELKTTS